MEKTYRIVDATIVHPRVGRIVKQNIIYYLDGIEELKEFYSKEGIIDHTIREGYIANAN